MQLIIQIQVNLSHQGKFKKINPKLLRFFAPFKSYRV